MKVNELMIGDWIQMKPTPLKVESIEKFAEGTPYYICAADGSLRLREYVFAYEPIPLTEEILKVNGFVKKELDHGGFLFSLEASPFVIAFISDNGCPIWIFEDEQDLDRCHTALELKDEIYNVHELQHALRLCGLDELADNFKIEQL